MTVSVNKEIETIENHSFTLFIVELSKNNARLERHCQNLCVTQQITETQ